MDRDVTIQELNARIAHLEENRRYTQNALEMVISLEELYTDVGSKNYTLDALLPEAKRRIDAIFPFDVLAFYMVDEQDFSFQLAYHYPDHLADEIQGEVDLMIEKGYFAWAIRERRGVLISSQDHQRQYLLHVVANHNQVRGMFGGLLPAGQSALPDTAMTLLSIVLLHVANASESMAYTSLLKDQSRILEREVAERTRDLIHSQKELQLAMEKAQAMAGAAEAASQAKGAFLANMSHELRTPLNGIIGMTEVALSSDLTANQRHIIEIIGRESYALLRQINDVLDFSKIESGKLELEEIFFDLVQLVEEVGEHFALQTSEKGVELNLFVDPQVSSQLKGDPHRLRQVLLNLTGNAVKFTHAGEICIEAHLGATEGERVQIAFTIKDTGIGIEADKIDQVFSSFSQADNSTTRQYGGTGLGTTISKQLVELMGGTIALESQPGQGSTFTFQVDFGLPHKEPVPLSASPTGMEGRTVLLVESHATTRRILEALLTQLGMTCLAVDSGKDALTALGAAQTHPPGIEMIIMADRLTDMDGLTLAEQLRSRSDDGTTIPLILATSLKEMVASGDETALGFTDIVAKPVKRAALQRALGRAADPDFVEETRVEAISKTVQEQMARPTRSGSILVVDDYPTNQQVAYMHLTSAGYRVELADDGQQAVDAVSKRPYDLILMDVQMPVLNGLDASRRIRQMETKIGRTSRTPILALTANALQGDEERCADAGMDGFLTKPIRRHQLIQAADQWIAVNETAALTPVAEECPGYMNGEAEAEAVIFDTAIALHEFGDAETVMMVARQLIDNAEGQLAEMERAIGEKDREAVRKQAHALKGGAATMEARALSQSAARLEALSPAGSEAELTDAFTDLETQLHQFRDFLSQWKGS